MNLNILKNIEDNSKFDVNAFIKELSERLKIMESKFVIDRFEEGFAVCENRDTKQMHNIEIKDLPEGAKEGTVLKFENGKYVIDELEEQEISNRIKQKMDNLWN